jgi:F0F1-type ATP synthase membrane subunit c/vacuolar-type H+-ATPase subunit K
MMEITMRLSKKALGAAIGVAVAASAVSVGVASAQSAEGLLANPLLWGGLFVVLAAVAFSDDSKSK